MNTKRKFTTLAIAALVFAAGAAFGAESDFQTAGNEDGSVTITKYSGWDTDVKIPATLGGKKVTAIGREAFREVDLTTVVIPDGVKTIGILAFAGNKLTSVAIPKSVTSIGGGAFSNNKLTGSITIGDGAQVFGSGDLFWTTFPGAFEGNQLTGVVIGSKAGIGSGAFAKNPLESLTLGNNVVIQSESFPTGKLVSVTLGANCDFLEKGLSEFIYYSYICNSRKAGTYALDSKWWQGSDEKAEGYTYKETTYGLIITGYQGDSTRLTIPDTLNGKPVKYIYRIGKAISGVRIPGGVIVIGNNAFSQDRLTTVSIGEGVTTIGDNAFAHNQLSSVTIPDSVTSIGKDAFAYNQLTSVTIGRGVVSFEAGVFASNEKLKNVTLPANVSLDDYTFGYYSGSYSGSYFKEAYEKNGKKAGTYTNPNVYDGPPEVWDK